MNERMIAKNEGRITYSTGRPCKNGHLSERYVSTGSCVDCLRATSDAYRTKNPELSQILLHVRIADIPALKAYADALLIAAGITTPVIHRLVYDASLRPATMPVNNTEVVDEEWANAPRPTLWSDPKPIPPKTK